MKESYRWLVLFFLIIFMTGCKEDLIQEESLDPSSYENREEGQKSNQEEDQKEDQEDKELAGEELEDISANTTKEVFQHEETDLEKIQKDTHFGDLDLGQLVMNPGEDIESAITFNLKIPQVYEGLELFVFDQEGKRIDKLMTKPAPLYHYKDTAIKDEYVHTIRIEGLLAGKEYTYVFFDGQAYSSAISYKMPTRDEVNLLVFGDPQGYTLEQYTNFRANYDQAYKQFPKVDMTLIAGDIVDKGDDLLQWGFFHEALGERLYERPVLTAIGNHDVKNGSYLYTSSFEYPENGLEDLKDRNFYIDIPGGRIAVWDTEKPSSFGQQSDWLEKVMSPEDLGFRIILMHRSVYPVSYDEAYVRKLAQVFEELNIDLVISGHDHIYSRTSMKGEQVVSLDQGVTYIVTGSSSGSKFYKNQDDDRYWKQIVYDEDYPVFTTITLNEKGLGLKAYAITDKGVKIVDSLYKIAD